MRILDKRTYNRRRQLIAMLLLAVLLPMLAVKSFHFHSESRDVYDHVHPATTQVAAVSADSDCNICHFLMPPFQVAGEVIFTPYFSITTVERNMPRMATVIVSILRAQANAPPMA